ncbi:CLUMA_CG015785, isoform A [Clunio marinus]|uniref:CLUMA_CG015785, isoform A n=1 Tax=Clunio marinus TaxID=568069 RepID=A0A1J1IS77_9DIPT|nr:CLUMA_CG015785, isoform A [Clunio marinus]
MGSKLKETLKAGKEYGSFYTGGTILWTLDGNFFLCRDGNKVNVISIKTLDVEKVLGADDSTSEDLIYTFSLTSNDENVVTAHRSGLLKLWDFKIGELIKSWKNLHVGPVSCLEYSPSAELLASGGTDSLIRIWDFKNQICKGTLKGAQGVISVMKFHVTENILIGAGDDTTIHAWDYETRKILRSFVGHISRITSLSFSLDGKFLVSSSRDKVLIFWDFNKGNQIRTIPIYEAIEAMEVLPYDIKLPNGIVLSDHSKVYVACAGEEGIVKIWQINDSKMLHKQNMSLISKASEEGGLAITQMLFNQQLEQITLVSFDHNIIIHDLSTFSCCKQLIGFNDEILDVVLLGKKDQYLAMATNSNDLKVYDTFTMNSIILKGHTDTVLALSAHKNFLLSSGKDNSIRLWKGDFESFSFKCVAVGMKHTGAVGSIAISKMSMTFFVSVSQDQCLKMWKLPDKIEMESLENVKLKCVNTQIAHEQDINCVTISPNDRYVATASQDRTAKLWDVVDLKLIGIFRGHRRGVWSVRFSPVDQIIVTNAADCLIKLWNIIDMTCLKTFEGHDNSVLRTEFISNGMQLLSVSADGLMKLWTIKSSECIQTLDNHESRIWTMAITEDETTIYTGGSDSKLIQWHDITEAKKEEEAQKKKEVVLQEQDLSNLLAQKKTMKALRLALNLNKPYMTLKIINFVIKNQEEGLKDTIENLRPDQKQSLLEHAVDWNSNSKNCRPAQLVFSLLMHDIIAGEYQINGLNKILEGSLPYSERHFKRMTEYMKDLKFIEYTMNCMQTCNDNTKNK